MGRAFSPLDERLALLATGYSPFLVAAMVRLGARLPFAQVAEELALLFGVSVSADTVRRLTEAAGAIQVAIEQGEVERLEHDAPEEQAGAPIQQVSADGAMVPVVDGSWMEVRTVAIGALEPGGDGMLAAHDLSYFSRCCSADQFIRQATLLTSERGTRVADTVVAVMDGAPWLQELIDEQCPAAVRIIDVAHAASYLSAAAQAAFGAGSREAASAGRARRGDPLSMVGRVAAEAQAGDTGGGAGGDPTITSGRERGGDCQGDSRAVLGQPGRAAPLCPLPAPGLSDWQWLPWARSSAPGDPLGMESAGKLVVEARMKGSGMHWSPQQLNPILALRGRLCSGQWSPTWAGIAQAWRIQMRTRQRAARQQRQAAREEQMAVEPAVPARTPASTTEQSKTIVDGKPTEAHPWKRYPALAVSK